MMKMISLPVWERVEEGLLRGVRCGMGRAERHVTITSHCLEYLVCLGSVSAGVHCGVWGVSL